jgi:hypothetical protein
MRSPHCNDPNGIFTQRPDQGVKSSIDQRDGAPPVLIVARRMFTDSRPAIKKQARQPKVEATKRQRPPPLLLVPLKFHGTPSNM